MISPGFPPSPQLCSAGAPPSVPASADDGGGGDIEVWGSDVPQAVAATMNDTQARPRTLRERSSLLAIAAGAVKGDGVRRERYGIEVVRCWVRRAERVRCTHGIIGRGPTVANSGMRVCTMSARRGRTRSKLDSSRASRVPKGVSVLRLWVHALTLHAKPVALALGIELTASSDLLRADLRPRGSTLWPSGRLP